jgi:hypothetical protein
MRARVRWRFTHDAAPPCRSPTSTPRSSSTDAADVCPAIVEHAFDDRAVRTGADEISARTFTEQEA